MKNFYWILGIFLGSCLMSVYGSSSASRHEELSDVLIKSHDIQKRWIKLRLTAECGVCMVNCLPKIQQANLKQKLRSRSCLELKKNGQTQNGFFTIYDNQNNSIPVYCDMTSETHSAWTLVMSWSLKNNKLFMNAPLTVNTPVNKNTPNWNLYRMTHAQMLSIQSHSTHWRVTCSFNTHAVDYTDYMRGNFRDFNILSYVGSGQCKKVDYINIRSHAATSTTAKFWQSNHWMLHVDSALTGCPFQVLANRGAVTGEDNFGFYHTVNPKFRCTASDDSTTQYWFGGYE